MQTDKTNSTVAVKAGIWYTISNFLNKGITFITTPIFTRLLTQEEFGDFSNFVTWLGILTMITTMDMHATINRARYDYADDIDGYLASVAFTGSAFTTVCWLIVVIFQNFFTGLFMMNMTYINIMFASMMVSPALSLLQAKHRVQYKYKSYAVLALSSVFLSTLISLCFVLVMNDRLFGRVIGQYGTLFIVELVIYIYIIVKGKRIRLSECKYALLICIPMIPHLISKYILNASDRVMIKHFCGSTDTALYSLAYNCAMIPIMFATAINISWGTWSIERIHEKDYRSIQKASVKYFLAFFSFVALIFLVGPEIVWILGGNEYSAAIWVIPPVVMGAAFQFINNIYAGIEQYAKKTGRMAIGSTLAAVINVALNFWLIPRYGYIAAAYTTLASYFILLVIHFLIVKQIGYGDVYNTKLLFLSLSALLAIMFITLLLYNYPVARYTILGVYILCAGFVIYKYREQIMSLFKRRKKEK